MPEKQILLFFWSVANRGSPTLGRETKPDIFCEWNTKFSIIPEILSKRVHSKRIPKFSKTLPGIFTVPFSFGPEISEFLVEWKAPTGLPEKLKLLACQVDSHKTSIPGSLSSDSLNDEGGTGERADTHPRWFQAWLLMYT